MSLPRTVLPTAPHVLHLLPPSSSGSSPADPAVPFFAWAEPRRACQLGMAASVTLDGFEPPTSCREAGALSRVSYRVRRVLGSGGVGWHQAEQSSESVIRRTGRFTGRHLVFLCEGRAGLEPALFRVHPLASANWAISPCPGLRIGSAVNPLRGVLGGQQARGWCIRPSSGSSPLDGSCSPGSRLRHHPGGCAQLAHGRCWSTRPRASRRWTAPSRTARSPARRAAGWSW